MNEPTEEEISERAELLHGEECGCELGVTGDWLTYAKLVLRFERDNPGVEWSERGYPGVEW